MAIDRATPFWSDGVAAAKRDDFSTDSELYGANPPGREGDSLFQT
jgi:hypothetical protein